MEQKELDGIRIGIQHEWVRQSWDALMSPLQLLDLTEKEEKQYALQAKEAVRHINWETYDTMRESFKEQCAELLQDHNYHLSDEEEEKVKEQMYIRFMEGRVYSFQYRERLEAYKGDPIPVGKDDLHNVELAMLFAHLPEQPDVARYLRAIDVSWEYDQLHMVTWFSGQLSLGEGNYSRSRPNHSAKKTYERLLNPYSLLWIAAALGEEPDVVRRAAYEMRDYASFSAKCGVVRRAVPWKRIYELAINTRNRLDRNNEME